MNGHCSSCDVEDRCGYRHKPCDCCNYAKFVEKPAPKTCAQVFAFPLKRKPAAPTPDQP